LVGLILGMVAGGVLAAAYAYLELYIPLAGVITFILTAGFGGLMGGAVGFLMKKQKVRSTSVTLLATLLVSLVAFYVSWGVWLYAALRRAEVDANLPAVLLQPDVMWVLILEINQAGAWSITSWTPTGAILWGFWGLEAVVIFALALLLAKSVIEGDPFCEHCETWCEETKDVLRVPLADPNELQQNMELRNFSYLEKLGGAKADAAAWMAMNIHSCPSCRNTHTLSMTSVTVTVDKKGKESREEKEVMDKLVLSSSEAENLRALGQKLKPPLDVATAGA
jgi:hypothetical protein